MQVYHVTVYYEKNEVLIARTNLSLRSFFVNLTRKIENFNPYFQILMKLHMCESSIF